MEQQQGKQQPQQRENSGDANSTSTALGSNHNPLKLGRACSGRLLLALTLIQEQLKNGPLIVSDIDEHDEGNSSKGNTKTNKNAALEHTKSTPLKLHYLH